jgi:hypothetical protein
VRAFAVSALALALLVPAAHAAPAVTPDDYTGFLCEQLPLGALPGSTTARSVLDGGPLTLGGPPGPGVDVVPGPDVRARPARGGGAEASTGADVRARHERGGGEQR